MFKHISLFLKEHLALLSYFLRFSVRYMFDNYDLSLAMIEMSSSLLCFVLCLYIVSILDADVLIFVQSLVVEMDIYFV